VTELAVPRRHTAAHLSSEEVRAAIEAEIGARWPDGATGLDAIHRYALQAPSKLLRPLLLCHSALAFGASLHQVLPAAVGFECAHTGSLLHDDILDNDPLRRGRPAVHTRYGPEQAIVAGNALFFALFTHLAECGERGISDDRIRHALAVQARAGLEVCRGAAHELTLAGDFDSGVAAYLAMARRKTAVMLAAACQIGAILAGAACHEQEKLAEFGEHLGLAFQIRDDLLPYDALGRSGKPGDSDLRNRRPTLPVLLALDPATVEPPAPTLRSSRRSPADRRPPCPRRSRRTDLASTRPTRRGAEATDPITGHENTGRPPRDPCTHSRAAFSRVAHQVAGARHQARN
jgi:geranylgeranyl pyrophosphate synthase